MFKFNCPKCERPLSGTDQLVDQTVQCPFCLNSITVPKQSSAPSPELVPPAPYNLFTDEFKSRLRHGKYKGWAETLKEEHLEALLCAVGEYGCRAGPILDLLRESGRSVMDPLWYGRAMLALETLAEFTAGRRVDPEWYLDRVREILDKYHSSTNTPPDGGSFDGDEGGGEKGRA